MVRVTDTGTGRAGPAAGVAGRTVPRLLLGPVLLRPGEPVMRDRTPPRPPEGS
jgi:hypothetical protein